MGCFYQTPAPFQLFVTVISSLAVIQGCPIVCSNGGTPLPSCTGCSCTGQWSGPYCSKPCGGSVSSLGGRITSPGFPKSYGNSENCTWVVSVPTNSTVVVSFDAMDLQGRYDFLYVHKGTTWDSDLVEKYTGNVLPYEMIMERPFLLTFLSDGSVSSRGFSLRFQTYQGIFPKFTNSVPDAHEDVTVRLGDNVTLRCNAFAVPMPKMNWRKNGVELVRNRCLSFHSLEQELVIVNVHLSDAAWYTCEAGNYLGTIHRSYQLIVQAPPTITHGPTSMHFDWFHKRQIATFRCDVFGIPTPQVAWKKDGIPLSSANYDFVYPTTWLDIGYVRLSDIGNYSCYASNTLGHVESNVASLTIRNTAVPAYRIHAHLKSRRGLRRVNVHQTTYFRIHYSPCSEAWYTAIYSNRSILNTSTDSRISTGRESTGHNRCYYYYYYSSLSEKDMRVYEIRLLPHRISWYVTVVVEVPPIAVIPTNGTISRHFRGKLTISCESKTGNPKPSFSWERNGLPVDHTWTGHIITVGYYKSYLTLTEDSDQQQTFEYSCTAINAAGTSTARVTVTVQSSDGWIESNRGSQCSSSYNSDYGLFLVQRNCTTYTRCSGLSVYSTVCPSFRTNCATDDAASGLNTQRPIVDTEQERGNNDGLSPGAAAGISVIVIAIVAVLSFAALWFVVNRIRQNQQRRVTEETLPAGVYSTPQFRSSDSQKCKSGKENVDIRRSTQSSTLPRGTSAQADSGETETKQSYEIAYASEEMHDSPAYVQITGKGQTVNEVPESDHDYDEACL